LRFRKGELTMNRLIYRALRLLLRLNAWKYGHGATVEVLRDLAGEWKCRNMPAATSGDLATWRERTKKLRDSGLVW
jgi:hypothetical protein